MDVKAGKILEDRGVWIEGDRIKEVGPITDVRKHAPRDVEEVDLRDATILPGLIDCHSHLLMNFSKQMGDDANMLLTVAQLGTTRRALLGVAMAREDLEAGFTTVRDLGNSGVNGDVALREAIQAGWVVGPRIVASTRALSAVGGQFASLVPEAQKLIEQEYVAISGVEEARRAVRQAIYDGADCIKVIVNTGPRVLSLEEMKVIVDGSSPRREEGRRTRRLATRRRGPPPLRALTRSSTPTSCPTMCSRSWRRNTSSSSPPTSRSLRATQPRPSRPRGPRVSSDLSTPTTTG